MGFSPGSSRPGVVWLIGHFSLLGLPGLRSYLSVAQGLPRQAGFDLALPRAGSPCCLKGLPWPLSIASPSVPSRCPPTPPLRLHSPDSKPVTLCVFTSSSPTGNYIPVGGLERGLGGLSKVWAHILLFNSYFLMEWWDKWIIKLET